MKHFIVCCSAILLALPNLYGAKGVYRGADSTHSISNALAETEIAKHEVSEIKKLAERGQADAQYKLAGLYYSGEGVPKDATEAVRWYRKAAEQGQVDAQINLGAWYYYGGEGVPKDMSEAVKWCRKAAEQGQADAQHILGSWYYSGEGVSKDVTEAVKWYRKAAEQGLSDAQLNLGACYEYGDGVPADESLAVTWYNRAAELGNARAMGELSVCYFVGYGVPLNITKATDWMMKAAEKGDGDALEPIKTWAIFGLCGWSGILFIIFLGFALQQILYRHIGRFGKRFITILRWVEAVFVPGIVFCAVLAIGGTFGLMLFTCSGITSPIPYLVIGYIAPILSAIVLPLTTRAFSPSNKGSAVVVIGLVWMFVLVSIGLALVLGGFLGGTSFIDIKQVVLFGVFMVMTIRAIADAGK